MRPENEVIIEADIGETIDSIWQNNDISHSEMSVILRRDSLEVTASQFTILTH